MTAPYRFPRLVRVLWTNPRRKSRQSIAAVRLARHENEAFDIANALEFALVPANAKRLVYQTAVMDKTPTARDALAMDTEWRTFWKEGVTA